MKRIVIAIVASILLASCGGHDSKPTEQSKAAPARPTYYKRNLDNMARLITYDVYGQKTGECYGVYVAPDIIVAPFDNVKGAFQAKITKMDSRQDYQVYGYVAYNIDDNLVALRVGSRISVVNPVDSAMTTALDTLYTLDWKKGKMLRTLCRHDSELTAGMPVFDINGNLRCLSDGRGGMISGDKLKNIISTLCDGHRNIYELRLKTNKVYPSYKTISGFRIETTMGNITIRLYNETPEYRDNFIRLVCDHYYDSLLVHRVLPNYLVQTGASDTKYAKKDDMVGWQGPGYTLPTHIVAGLFHRRGAVAASKLPAEHNESNRSDGGQFFIVAGRKFSLKELTGIEKDYSKKFSKAQIDAYTTVGGAPYLDGDYTVFGEVVSGMDIVDKMAAVPVDGDRPVSDIRVKKIVLVRK